jgi:cobalamin biosynthesis Mg chelatase CobN
MLEWLEPRLDAELRAQFEAVRAEALGPQEATEQTVTTVAEVTPESLESDGDSAAAPRYLVLALALVLLLIGGMWRGYRNGDSRV